MSTHVTAAYALTVVGFAVGLGLAARLATADDVDANAGKFAYLGIIPGFAGLSYVLMTFDIGVLTVGSQTIVVPRYVDWLITTPILIGYIGHVAGAPRKWIAGVVAADAAMIVTGSVAAVTDGMVQASFFAISAAFHLSLLYVLYAVFPKYAREQTELQGLFKLLQNHVGLLWLAYPLVGGFGTLGLGYVSAAGVSLIFAYLDVVAKVPYVYFVWSNRYAFGADASGSTGESPSAPGGVPTADD